MTDTITLPWWLFFIIALLACWALIERLLFPGVRWFFRRRVNVVIDEINKRLDLQLPAFKLTKRQVLIDRLLYDPKVLEAVDEYCLEQDAPKEVAMKKVAHYAKEIVPSFNAYFYFRFGSWLSKSITRFLYRVRLGYSDDEGLAKIDPKSSVVFLMNHRSNMDYILLAHLALQKTALSYAVGEWARVWPVQQLIRSMGGYFVRRSSGNTLYRRVLARYVQMATEGGVVQAVFPEGGLSRDGNMRPPKIGLLDYMLRSFDPDGERDLVFIPVGVNYDRVLEDRTLLLDTNPQAEKKSGFYAIKTTLNFLLHNIVLMLRGGWYRFGYTAVNFGSPISMREYVKTNSMEFRNLDREKRFAKVQALADDLMLAIGKVIPVLPVSLIAYAFMVNPDKVFSDLELKAQVQNLIDDLEERGAHVYIPRSDREYAINVGIRMLTLRHIVIEEDNLFRVSPEETKILSYYANAIKHLFTASDKV